MQISDIPFGATVMPPQSRRAWLAWLVRRAGGGAMGGAVGGLAATSAGAVVAATQGGSPPLPTRQFAAAWRRSQGTPPGGDQVGVLEWRAGQPLVVRAGVDVPTRAHAVMIDPQGALLVVARRPGEWLLRLTREGQVRQRVWIEPDRAFNGHACFSADGHTLCTSETDLHDGQGLLGVRDARTLRKRAEWRTHGMDPHAIVRDPQGHWMVANGGMPTMPETGRVKLDRQRMDASLVRLHRDHGHLLGQWRLDDPRLSLRHLAWGAQGHLGIALQGEHEDPVRKAQASVLAWFDGQTLQLAPQPEPLSGYGGDIAAVGADWVVSCPRSNRVAWWRGAGAGSPAGVQWGGTQDLAGACALASQGAQVWMGGTQAVSLREGALSPVVGVALDNHWAMLG